MILALVVHGGKIPCECVGDATLAARATAFVRRTGFPGVWIGVAREGRIVGTACAGWADPVKDRRAILTNGLRVGSVSKPFLDTVVAEAVRQGRIAYSDRVYDVLPELRERGLPVYADVTLEMLVSHTAGLERDDRLTRFEPPPTPADYPKLRLEEAIAVFGTRPLSRPGTRFAYSNVGVEVAAAMLERKTGVPYERLFDETFRGRLGLASAGIGEVGEGRTAPFLVVKGGLQPSPAGTYWPYCYGAYGSVHVDIADLVRFGLAHCENRFGERLFDDEWLARIHAKVAPGDVTRAGFHRSDGRGGATLFHNGLLLRQRGDSTQLWIDPVRGIVVAAYTNVGQGTDQRGPTPNEILKKDLIEPLLAQMRKPGGTEMAYRPGARRLRPEPTGRA